MFHSQALSQASDEDVEVGVHRTIADWYLRIAGQRVKAHSRRLCIDLHRDIVALTDGCCIRSRKQQHGFDAPRERGDFRIDCCTYIDQDDT
jgi:hypothetical protein